MKIYPSAQHKQSVPYLIFIGLIILQSLAVGIIMLKQHGMGEEILLTHAKEMMQRLADGAIFNASHHLQSAENTAHITRGLIKDGILSPNKAKSFEMYLLEMLKNHDAFSGLTYGDQEGKLLYVSRSPGRKKGSYLTKRIFFTNNVKQETIIQRNADFIPHSRVSIQDDYDPRTRPWYNSFTQQKLLWTIPYIFYTSNDPGITVSIPVVDANDNLTGAFGVDIEINSLSKFLARRKISPHSSAFIVGRGGAIAAHSNIDLIKETDSQGHSQLLNITELTTDPVMNQLWIRIKELDEDSLLKGSTFAFQVDGAKYLAVVRSFPEDSEWPWIMTVLAPENDFIGIFRKARRNKLFQALGYSIGITLFLFLLAAKFLKPVRRLLHHAHFDPMTNLYNRRAFFEHCEKKEAEAKIHDTPLCLAMIDVDNFKKINDAYGHGVGDELLIAIAGRLQGALSDNDLIGRYGGEEFVVLITNASLEQGMRVCERLRRVIDEAPFRTEVGQLNTSISIGVASLACCPDAQEAITLADKALLRAKRAGKNTVIPSGN
jgi:diguanylate cyclase (GGDEF)-like protein